MIDEFYPFYMMSAFACENKKENSMSKKSQNPIIMHKMCKIKISRAPGEILLYSLCVRYFCDFLFKDKMNWCCFAVAKN